MTILGACTAQSTWTLRSGSLVATSIPLRVASRRQHHRHHHHHHHLAITTPHPQPVLQPLWWVLRLRRPTQVAARGCSSSSGDAVAFSLAPTRRSTCLPVMRRTQRHRCSRSRCSNLICLSSWTRTRTTSSRATKFNRCVFACVVVAVCAAVRGRVLSYHSPFPTPVHPGRSRHPRLR